MRPAIVDGDTTLTYSELLARSEQGASSLIALGVQARHRDALPYFQREVQLYPYDDVALQRLFMCRVAAGETTRA